MESLPNEIILMIVDNLSIKYRARFSTINKDIYNAFDGTPRAQIIHRGKMHETFNIINNANYTINTHINEFSVSFSGQNFSDLIGRPTIAKISISKMDKVRVYFDDLVGKISLDMIDGIPKNIFNDNFYCLSYSDKNIHSVKTMSVHYLFYTKYKMCYILNDLSKMDYKYPDIFCGYYWYLMLLSKITRNNIGIPDYSNDVF